MSVQKTCEEILTICKNDHKPYQRCKSELIKLLFDLEGANISCSQKGLVEFIRLHRELFKIKNRKASYIEEEMARKLMVSLPFQIRMNDEGIPEEEVEELQLSYDKEARSALKMSSLLFQHGKEILGHKEEKSKRYKKRIKEALRLFDELNQFYVLPNIKSIFLKKMNDSDKEVQFFALVGLENYYAHENVDKITKEEYESIEQIIDTTPKREIAATCCQILINSGKIDELQAVLRMDDWKERNWK